MTAAPLRVVVVAACPFPAERGTPVRIRRLSEGLAARGHHVHVVTYHLGDAAPLPDLTIHRIAPVASYTKTAPGPTLGKLTVLDVRLSRLLADIMGREEPDVIYAHHVEGLLVARAARVLSGCQVPLLFDVHTSLQSELQHYGPTLVRPLARWAGRNIDRNLPRLADHVSTVTDELRTLLINQAKVDPSSVTCVENGLELELFEKAAASKEARVPGETLVWSGNLAAYQGIGPLLEAFALVRRRRPRARLRIITRDDFAPFRPYAKTLGIDGAIDVDNVPFRGVPDSLALADVALNPRVDAPGLPQKTLNYLAVGLPIVSFAGSGHHLTDGATAVIVEDGNVSAFADAACRLLTDAVLSRRIAANGRAFVRSKASWSESSARLERLMRGLLVEPEQIRA